MNELTPEHYWAAGFLEGEGSFTVSGGLALQIMASQKQRQPLERLQDLLGGRITRIYWQGRKYWRWSLNGNKRAEPVLLLLRPLMSPRRQWQIDKAIEKRVLKVTSNCGNRMKTMCPKGHPYDVFRTEKNGRPHRRCSICDRENGRKRRARRRAAA